MKIIAYSRGGEPMARVLDVARAGVFRHYRVLHLVVNKNQRQEKKWKKILYVFKST